MLHQVILNLSAGQGSLNTGGDVSLSGTVLCLVQAVLIDSGSLLSTGVSGSKITSHAATAREDKYRRCR